MFSIKKFFFFSVSSIWKKFRPETWKLLFTTTMLVSDLHMGLKEGGPLVKRRLVVCLGGHKGWLSLPFKRSLSEEDPNHHWRWVRKNLCYKDDWGLLKGELTRYFAAAVAVVVRTSSPFLLAREKVETLLPRLGGGRRVQTRLGPAGAPMGRGPPPPLSSPHVRPRPEAPPPRRAGASEAWRPRGRVGQVPRAPTHAHTRTSAALSPARPPRRAGRPPADNGAPEGRAPGWTAGPFSAPPRAGEWSLPRAPPPTPPGRRREAHGRAAACVSSRAFLSRRALPARRPGGDGARGGRGVVGGARGWMEPGPSVASRAAQAPFEAAAKGAGDEPRAEGGAEGQGPGPVGWGRIVARTGPRPTARPDDGREARFHLPTPPQWRTGHGPAPAGPGPGAARLTWRPTFAQTFHEPPAGAARRPGAAAVVSEPSRVRRAAPRSLRFLQALLLSLLYLRSWLERGLPTPEPLQYAGRRAPTSAPDGGGHCSTP